LFLLEQNATGKDCFPPFQPLHSTRLKQPNDKRIALLAGSIFALDQLTKALVQTFLPIAYQDQMHVLPGFFRLVHWHNTGAAWSMFHDNNWILAGVSALALVILIVSRSKFAANTTLGSISLGLIFGGIAGNLVDRVVHEHVIDFLYFHLITRSGVLHDFPAFNVADSAICIGVALLFILSWRSENPSREATS
jgi:signal peptidase II